MWNISTPQDECPGPFINVSVDRDGNKVNFMVNKESLFELIMMMNAANRLDSFLFKDKEEDD